MPLHQTLIYCKTNLPTKAARRIGLEKEPAKKQKPKDNNHREYYDFDKTHLSIILKVPGPEN